MSIYQLNIYGKDKVETAGSWCYIPEDIPHYFKNDGNDIFEFICIVPPEGDVNPNDSDLFEC